MSLQNINMKFSGLLLVIVVLGLFIVNESMASEETKVSVLDCTVFPVLFTLCYVPNESVHVSSQVALGDI